jgi:hypothetical protein
MLSVRKKEGGRPASNRNLEDHDLGCCRYTTTTMRRCRLRRRRLITVGSTPKSNAGKSSWAAKRAGFSGGERGRPDSNRRVLA